MSFTNRLGKVSIGMGNPISNDSLFLSQGNALSGTGEQETKLQSLSPAIQHGKIRLKVSNGAGTSPTLVAARVVVTDGTTSEEVWAFNPATAVALSTTSWADLTFEFLSDLAVTEIGVYTTLGGTSPTATLDVEAAVSN